MINKPFWAKYQYNSWPPEFLRGILGGGFPYFSPPFKVTSAEIFALHGGIGISEGHRVPSKKNATARSRGENGGVQRKATKTKFQSYMNILYIYIYTHIYASCIYWTKKQGKTAKQKHDIGRKEKTLTFSWKNRNAEIGDFVFGSMEVDEISSEVDSEDVGLNRRWQMLTKNPTLWNLVKRFEISLIERPRPLVEVCCKL